MIAVVGNQQIDIVTILEENRKINGKQQNVLKLILSQGLNLEQLEALKTYPIDISNGYMVYEGYSTVYEHSIVLLQDADDILKQTKAQAKLAQEEVDKLQKEIITKNTEAEKQTNEIFTLVKELPDIQAIKYIKSFPKLKFKNDTITIGTRIQYNGVLYKAKVKLQDNEQNAPNNAPELWELIIG